MADNNDKRHRSAVTGRLASAADAEASPETHVAETRRRSVGLVRGSEEVEREIDDAFDSSSDGDLPARFPGMRYEDGVFAALQWVTGRSDDRPMGE